MTTQNDPAPWVHASGVRVAHPFGPDSPVGGFTYLPREGYADHPDRYVSTRSLKWEVAS